MTTPQPMNENIKHLREIVEHNIPEETPIAEALIALDLLEADLREWLSRIKSSDDDRIHLSRQVVRLREALHSIADTHGYSDDTFDHIRALATESLKESP